MSVLPAILRDLRSVQRALARLEAAVKAPSVQAQLTIYAARVAPKSLHLAQLKLERAAELLESPPIPAQAPVCLVHTPPPLTLPEPDFQRARARRSTTVPSRDSRGTGRR